MHKIAGCRAKYTIPATIIWRACLLCLLLGRGLTALESESLVFPASRLLRNYLPEQINSTEMPKNLPLNAMVEIVRGCVWVRSLKG